MSENRYKLALEIQDACNITALAGLFHKVCLEVPHEDSCTGTAKVCKDPAVILIVDKLHDMVGRLEGKEYTAIYLACCHQADIVVTTQEVSSVTG